MADSYQYEGAVEYNYRTQGDRTMNLCWAGVAIFEKVVTLAENVPYAEAFFYQKASYLVLNGLYGKDERTGDNDYKLDIMSIRPGLRAVFPVPVIIDLTYQFTSWDGDYTGIGYEIKSNSLGTGLGYFIMEGFSVEAAYTFSSYKYKMEGYSETEKKVNTGIADVKYLGLINNRMSFSLQGTYNFVNSKTGDMDALKNNIAILNGAIYITPAIGMGLGVAVNKGDDKTSEGEEYGISGSYFFTPAVKIKAAYTRFNADNEEGAGDSNNFTIVLAGRL